MGIWLLDDDLDWGNVLDGSICQNADFRDCGCRLPPEHGGKYPLLAGIDLDNMCPNASTNQEPTERALGCNVLIKQTAKMPMAYLAPYPAIWFRDSVIGAYATDPNALIDWLNSPRIRALYRLANRGVRSGIPQISIAGLRALPSIGEDWVLKLTELQMGRLAREITSQL